jgi:hypothetical protein
MHRRQRRTALGQSVPATVPVISVYLRPFTDGHKTSYQRPAVWLAFFTQRNLYTAELRFRFVYSPHHQGEE